MRIDITVPELDLSSVVSGDEDDGPVTLADLIASTAVRRSAVDNGWYNNLNKRVAAIRDEEIREAVRPLIAEALTAGIRRTNGFGEPVGEPTTLRELIAETVRNEISKPGDRYGSTDKDNVIRTVIRTEVREALRAELVGTIKAEREKVVVAVRESAAELIAEAVRKGIGS